MNLLVSAVIWIVLYLIGFWIFAYVTQGLILPPPNPGGVVVLLVLFVVSKVYSRRRQRWK